MRMLAYNAVRDNARNYPRKTYGDVENEYRTDRTEYNGSAMNYGGVEGRFRDRRGREHYDNGRYAPMSDYDVNYTRPLYTTEERRDYTRPMNKIGFEAKSEVDHDYRSSADYGRMDEMEHRQGAMQSGHAKSEDGPKLDDRMAEEWMESLHSDGKRGPHWDLAQVKQVMAQRGLHGDPIEMWVAMNSVYSDLSKVLKKYNVNSLDAYIDIAKAFWLEDEDAMPDKLARYYQSIVRH